MGETSSASKSIHSGHRERVREKVELSGLDGMPEHEVLEYILFHSIPRGDVNELAHALIEQFGSLAGVLDASPQKLQSVKGVGSATALLLSSLPSIFRIYRLSQLRRKRFYSLEELEQHLAQEVSIRLTDRKVETLMMACLTNSNTLISIHVVATGTIHSVNIPIRTVAEIAMSVNAAKIVLAHNHPYGIAVPSTQDVDTTRTVQNALLPIGIELLDHIVVGISENGDYDYVSMRNSAMLAN